MAYRGRGWDTWETLSTELEIDVHILHHLLYSHCCRIYSSGSWLLTFTLTIHLLIATLHTTAVYSRCRGFDLLDGSDTCILDFFQEIEGGRVRGSRG